MKLFVTELTTFEQNRVVAALESVFPRVLPVGWRGWGADDFFNARWMISSDGLKVCCEVEMQEHEDGKRDIWLHVSFSRPDRDPSYFDMTRVKETFVGAHRKAIMVLPKREEHFSFAKHCLHFYSPLEADPLPDFRAECGSL